VLGADASPADVAVAAAASGRQRHRLRIRSLTLAHFLLARSPSRILLSSFLSEHSSPLPRKQRPVAPCCSSPQPSDFWPLCDSSLTDHADRGRIRWEKMAQTPLSRQARPGDFLLVIRTSTNRLLALSHVLFSNARSCPLQIISMLAERTS
jgi:hypothetical protein